MLLSADIFASILTSGKVQNTCNKLIAINTNFGWILSGSIPNSSQTLSTNLCSVLTAIPSDCESLDQTFKRFWELEGIPNHNFISDEDSRCEAIFKNTTARDKNGRYIVSLPFRSDNPPTFGNSRDIALRCFYNLENRLDKNKHLKSQYDDCMQNYLDSNYMSIAPQLSDPSRGFYLPHHAVQKLDSSTTKTRIVYNASQKCSEGISLNDTLCTGPKLQANIITLLLRFRFYPIVFTADIRQMYLQILLSENHRSFQRLFWRFSKAEPISEYVLNTVTFGISSSPFLSQRTILQLAEDEGHNFPLAKSILQNDIYIDNILTGCQTLEQAQILISQLVDIFQRGCFELRKWASNHPKLLNFLPESYKEIPIDFDDEKSVIKLFGLRWSPLDDAFMYKVLVQSNECTKRSILSELARIFDSLGFLSPLTFFAKHLTQTLWRLGLDWDQKPPEEIISIWNQYKSELPHLSSLIIPRFLKTTDAISIELHGFCDASQRGYGCVIYLRITNPDLSYSVFLVAAKSKVAPLKIVTIPRLELCAAVLLADLIAFVHSNYKTNIRISQTYAWSDSKVVLSWIKSHPNRWKTFVGNRVAHIQGKIHPNYWHHISGVDNIADIASRGCLPLELLNNSSWWAGPSFLKSEELPLGDYFENQSEPLDEVLTEESRTTLNISVEAHPILVLLDKFSSLDKIQRIVAYCNKFIIASRTHIIRDRKITFSELNASMTIVIKLVQRDVFSKDIANLKNGHSLSKTLRKLCPFLDKNDILRVGGRLVHSKLSYDKRFPILLPRNHRLTSLIIESFHIKHLHVGLRTLQFLLSQQYWILSPRRAIRSVISKCHKCFRANPKTFQPLMGDLPSFRVSQVKPFSCVGCDYDRIKTNKLKGAKIVKAYLCLFVCCATKALHLELASDLTSDCFLAAFRRFMARRGKVTHVRSDGGTNFVGAHKYLSEVMRDVVTSEKIQWSFNPPATPHFGGLFEGGIRSVKTHLSRVVGDLVLTYEEFYTVLVQIEAILNSRPLVETSSDPSDLSVLTPGKLLTLEPLTCVPDPDMTNIALNRLDRWQLLQKLHQDFWRRWHVEYLHSLHQRNKWTENNSCIGVNDLVLIKEDNLPALKWKTGRVIELFPGPDKVVRVALVKTAEGTYRRGLAKLCPLPKHRD